MHAALIPHHGGVNRVRVRTPRGQGVCEYSTLLSLQACRLGVSTVAAVWNDQAKVQLWNLTPAMNAVNDMTGKTQSTTLKKEKPLHSFVGHQGEGFALDWSPLALGASPLFQTSTLNCCYFRAAGLWR